MSLEKRDPPPPNVNFYVSFAHALAQDLVGSFSSFSSFTICVTLYIYALVLAEVVLKVNDFRALRSLSSLKL